ncbi:MAG: MucB/RseB C-terminal domain-containing protein [Alcanivoracaceae bacterium]|nr:MucB/RseB C-terminal domain-containing protein [Alcanivoracaceae bacterium]
MLYRVLAVVVMCLSAFAFAETPTQKQAAPSPQQLLQEMAKAVHDRDFSGRLVYVRGNDMSTLEVLHARIDGREYERLTHLDGKLAELIRHGEQLVCVHPDKTITRLGGRAGVGPLAMQDQLARSLPEQYEIKIDGQGRVAGRNAWMMHVLPGDGFRYGYRLWIDTESYLMLRSELVNEKGQALERLEFISLDLSPNLKVEQFAVPAAIAEQALEPVDASVHPQGRLKLETSWLPDGFVAAAGDLRLTSGEQSPVSSRAFSDGLAAFTVFVERLPEQNVQDGMSQMGPTVALTKRFTEEDGEWLVTLVGEVPPDTALKVVAGLSLSNTLRDGE